MRTALAWLLWLWIALVIVGALIWSPLAVGFKGQSSRILFFHVPMAWVSFLAFLTAGGWSIAYLLRRNPRADQRARVAVELGLMFCILATVTGAIWARIMWGTYWNWDPREITIVLALLFYGAYLALRSAIEDAETEARLAAVYAVLGVVVAPFFYFVLPRISGFTLHPEPVVNGSGRIEMEWHMQVVLFGSLIGFTALFFWLHSLQCRLERRRETA